MLTATQRVVHAHAEENPTPLPSLGQTPTYPRPNHRDEATRSVTSALEGATTMIRTMSTLAEMTAGAITAAM